MYINVPIIRLIVWHSICSMEAGLFVLGCYKDGSSNAASRETLSRIDACFGHTRFNSVSRGHSYFAPILTNLTMKKHQNS